MTWAAAAATRGVASWRRGRCWPISTFFEIRFKIKWLEKECIFQTFDQNKVHFNQNLGSKSSAFQASESKAVKSSAAPQVPPRTWQGTQGGLRRAWLRRTRDEGGTTNAASESSAGEVVAPA